MHGWQVDSHPFALDTMVFMDWRDSHLQSDPVLRQRGIDLPTFLYAMPLSPTRIFLGMLLVTCALCAVLTWCCSVLLHCLDLP